MVSSRKLRPRSGWGLVETTIATLVAAVLSIPLLWVFITSRTDTAKAINYLRALELANEAIDWIASTPIGPNAAQLLTANTESLVVPGSGGRQSTPYRLGTSPKWAANLPKGLTYPTQYGVAFFHRTIEIEPVNLAAGDHRQYLYRATVTVAWNEKDPPADEKSPDRAKKVVLSTLLCDERRGY